ncbi:BNR Asp-box repeat [Lecanosticta acicola]|uniref:BNR Asp-box repeat n=1 Tax=Lecanosticta acicola TaxID=111012 RepID=A0AAI8Z3J6_9PEZI|nr:BNR Asp-box repeat [Lecanosticta acicola]
MLLLSVFLSLLPFCFALPQYSYNQDASAPDLDSVLILDPPADYTAPRTLYARTLQLKESGVLLATWENYLPNNDSFPYFPIYQSLDYGQTWAERTRVYDQVNNWGMRYQPFLYELEEPIGNFSAGTILLAGSSIPQDLSQTQLELYASADCGCTFNFVSHVAKGGVALPDNGETPVWEPFLMMYEGQMIYYYSDQRDPAHGQKLVHQTSTDLLTWGDVVDDVAYDTYDWRPGMTTVSLLPNGSYLLTYEFYGAVEEAFAVYYRLSENPLLFDSAPGQVIRATDDSFPVGSPYNVWTPAGGENGTIVVSCGNEEQLWISKDLTATWERVDTVEKTSYTRSLLVERQDPNTILIVGAGVLGGEDNNVTASTWKVDG